MKVTTISGTNIIKEITMPRITEGNGINSGTETASKGMLESIRCRLENNLLGELLVMSGDISFVQLREALAIQKTNGKKIGTILIKQGNISLWALRRAIAKQVTYRFLAILLASFISLSPVNTAKSAKASNYVRDMPVQLSVVGLSSDIYSPIIAYPKLFGYDETKSVSMGAFKKWTGMFDRFDDAVKNHRNSDIVNQWKQSLVSMRGLPLKQLVTRVNNMINSIEYINDSKLWYTTDYWANPIEFFSKGGDCEDFAIAKYFSLRMLGVPDERMRIAIVQDLEKNIPHAILIVYLDNGPVMLDNQNKRVLSAYSEKRYKPIFSINRDAWWLHTKQGVSSYVSASTSSGYSN